MGGYGYGYGAGAIRGDQEADNWLKVAALSGKLNDEFTEESANMGANALMSGGKLPDGMSDAARNQAYLTAPKLEEGAIFEKKNSFLREATEAAKAKGTTVDNILMNPPDNWFADPSGMGHKAYAAIAKDMSEANINSDAAIKSHQLVNEEKFKQFDAYRTEAKNLYARGDKAGTANVLKEMINTSQIPFHVDDYDEKTDTFGMKELDIGSGKAVPSSQRVPMPEVMAKVSSLGQQQLVAGATMASITAAKINRESFDKPQHLKDKDGNIFFGTNLINPGTLTDTVMQVRDSKTGKVVASVNDSSKLGDMGFTVFEPKFEKDVLGIQHEKLAIVGQGLQNRNHELGAQGLLLSNSEKRLSLKDKEADIAFQADDRTHKKSMWADEETSKHSDAIKSSYAAREAIIKQKDERASAASKLIFGADGNSGTENFSNQNSYYQSPSDIYRDVLDFGDNIYQLSGGKVGAEEASRLATEAVKRSAIDPKTGGYIKDESLIKANQQAALAKILDEDPAVLSVRMSHPDWSRDRIEAAAIEGRQKAAAGKAATDAASKKAVADKDAQRVFDDIGSSFERIKNQMTSSQYGMDKQSDDELWVKAAQDPVFGKSLYDIQQAYYPDKTNSEILQMAKERYSGKKAQEVKAKSDEEVRQYNKSLGKTNKADFFKYGAGNLTAGGR